RSAASDEQGVAEPDIDLRRYGDAGRLWLGHDDGRGRRRRYRGRRREILCLGRDGGWALWGWRGLLGRRGGRLSCISGLFHNETLCYPGCNRPHGLTRTIAVATPKSNAGQSFTTRHPFAIRPWQRRPAQSPHLQRVPLEFK